MGELIYPTDPGGSVGSDINLFRRAVKERWPISDETRQQWLERLDHCVTNGSIRETVSALKVAATMDAINQRDELAAKYAIPAGEGGTSVRPLHEEIAAMIQSMPLLPQQESIVEPVETVWPNPPISSCSPPAIPDTDTKGAGGVVV